MSLSCSQKQLLCMQILSAVLRFFLFPNNSCEFWTERDAQQEAKGKFWGILSQAGVQSNKWVLSGLRMTEGAKELITPLKIKLSALETKSHRWCLSLSRCCSSGYSSGMTSSAGTDLCHHSDTPQYSRELFERTNITHFSQKITSFFHFCLLLFSWVVFRGQKVTWTPNSFPFDEGIHENFIRGGFSFPRNHKYLLKSMHSFCQTGKNPILQDKTNMQKSF